MNKHAIRVAAAARLVVYSSTPGPTIALAIPGVAAVREAHLFAAGTSGGRLLSNHEGRLFFQGGITASRGLDATFTLELPVPSRAS